MAGHFESTFKFAAGILDAGGTFDAYSFKPDGDCRGEIKNKYSFRFVRDRHSKLLDSICMYQGRTFRSMITRSNMADLDDFFEEYTFTNYKQCKTSETWKSHYDLKYRPFWWKRKGLFKTRNYRSMYCASCGICLPAKVITLDHVRAQSKGYALAMYKLFQTIGFTESKPQGDKNLELRRNYAASVGGKFSGTGELKLNSAGILVFSLVRRGTGLLSYISLRSLHSVPNIRPVCLFCNSSKGNRTHYTNTLVDADAYTDSDYDSNSTDSDSNELSD